LAPPPSPTYIEKTDFPVVQNSTDDDLSFADFSGCDDDQHYNNNHGSNNNNNSHHHNNNNNNANNKSTSLSGFLEDGSSGNAPPVPPPPPPPHGGSSFSLRRRNKVCAVDVASVGNASDTLISTIDQHGDHHHNGYSYYVSGRDLHETAKIAFNAGQYQQALPLFESILASQARRFTAYHPSVGAALHSVWVRDVVFVFCFFSLVYIIVWYCLLLFAGWRKDCLPGNTFLADISTLFPADSSRYFVVIPGLSATHGGKRHCGGIVPTGGRDPRTNTRS
jgi:hypothetical protein